MWLRVGGAWLTGYLSPSTVLNMKRTGMRALLKRKHSSGMIPVTFMMRGGRERGREREREGQEEMRFQSRLHSSANLYVRINGQSDWLIEIDQRLSTGQYALQAVDLNGH